MKTKISSLFLLFLTAWDMGFDFVGCEIDKTYFELEEERFRKHTAQTRMF